MLVVNHFLYVDVPVYFFGTSVWSLGTLAPLRMMCLLKWDIEGNQRGILKCPIFLHPS